MAEVNTTDDLDDDVKISHHVVAIEEDGYYDTAGMSHLPDRTDLPYEARVALVSGCLVSMVQIDTDEGQNVQDVKQFIKDVVHGFNNRKDMAVGEEI